VVTGELAIAEKTSQD